MGSWLEGTNECVCYICQEGVEDTLHFLLDCSFLCEHFSLMWSKLQQKILKVGLFGRWSWNHFVLEQS